MKDDFAIIKFKNTQYLVQKDDKITVDKLSENEGDIIKTSDVLLLSKGKKISIGKPNLEKAIVEMKVVGHFKGKKIEVFKYTAKSRSRKKKGHRQMYTTLEIKKI